MKTKSFFLALFAITSLCLNAQSDYSNYLNKAMEKLDEGDCSSAQKFYNVYKELSGTSVSSIEVLIADCSRGSKKAYAINDKITIGNYIYRVAYTEDQGVHGFAIYDYGAGPLTDQMIKNRQLPTRSEMGIIAEKAKELKLDGGLYYWTLDKKDDTHNYVYKPSTKSTDWFLHTSSYNILLIYRF